MTRPAAALKLSVSPLVSLPSPPSTYSLTALSPVKVSSWSVPITSSNSATASVPMLAPLIVPAEKSIVTPLVTFERSRISRVASAPPSKLSAFVSLRTIIVSSPTPAIIVLDSALFSVIISL